MPQVAGLLLPERRAGGGGQQRRSGAAGERGMEQRGHRRRHGGLALRPDAGSAEDRGPPGQLHALPHHRQPGRAAQWRRQDFHHRLHAEQAGRLARVAAAVPYQQHRPQPDRDAAFAQRQVDLCLLHRLPRPPGRSADPRCPGASVHRRVRSRSSVPIPAPYSDGAGVGCGRQRRRTQPCSSKVTSRVRSLRWRAS